MLLLTHKLHDEGQVHFNRALCTNSQTPIEGGMPLAEYLSDESPLWQKLVNRPLEGLPESFKVVPGQRESLEPVWNTKWLNHYTLERFTSNPQINKHTGKLEARIRLSGVKPEVDCTIKKIEIIPQEMWRKQVQPMQSQMIRKQLQAVCNRCPSNTATAEIEGAQEEEEEAEENDEQEEDQYDSEEEAEEVINDTVNEVERYTPAAASLELNTVQDVYDSPHNPSYLEALTHYALDFMREQKLTPAAPIYYYSARLTDGNFFKGRERHFNPMPVMLLALEQLHETMKASWTEDPYLDGKRVLADLFQAVFGLAAVQAHLGLVHGAFDLTTLRARHEQQAPQHLDPRSPEFGGPFIFYQWGAKYYRVPTAGRVWKMIDFDNVSLVFRGQRLVSLDMQEVIRNMPIPYQKDLVTFARQAIPVLEKELIDEDPLKQQILDLLHSYTTCWSATQMEVETMNPINTTTPDTAEDLTQLEVEVCRNRNSPECKNQFFERLGKHAVCSNAIPYLQQHHFSVFEVAKQAIPANCITYKLMIPLQSSTSSAAATEISTSTITTNAEAEAPAEVVVTKVQVPLTKPATQKHIIRHRSSSIMIAAVGPQESVPANDVNAYRTMATKNTTTTLVAGGNERSASKERKQFAQVDTALQAKQILKKHSHIKAVMYPKFSSDRAEYEVLYRTADKIRKGLLTRLNTKARCKHAYRMTTELGKAGKACESIELAITTVIDTC